MHVTALVIEIDTVGPDLLSKESRVEVLILEPVQDWGTVVDGRALIDGRRRHDHVVIESGDCKLLVFIEAIAENLTDIEEGLSAGKS